VVVGTVFVMAGPPVSGQAPSWLLPWRGRLAGGPSHTFLTD
jgi:hypothetical protein